MIIAVLIVRVMEMPIDQIVDMIAVRHRFVAATGAMCMGLRMASAKVFGRAIFRIVACNSNYMFISVIPVLVMQMPVMQIIDMIIMHDTRMAALRPVWMSMIFVLWQVTISHLAFLLKDVDQVAITSDGLQTIKNNPESCAVNDS